MILATSSTSPRAPQVRGLHPLRRRVQDLDRVEGEGSQRKIALISALRLIIQKKLYLAWGFKSFEAYRRADRLSFDEKTARKRFPIADLPPGPFAGNPFS